MKAVRIDPTKFTVEEIDIESFEIVEGLYIRTSSGLSPAAYYFPVEKAGEVRAAMSKLKAAHLEYEQIQAQVFYQELPKLRRPTNETSK